MSLHVIRSDYVSDRRRWLMLGVGREPWMLGVVGEAWGVRVMLVWWHVCWHWPKKPLVSDVDDCGKENI